MPWSDPGGNKNDNPWGRRPNQQKPPFDIKKITEELRRLGGALGGKGGPGAPREWMNKLPLIVAGVVALIWIASGIYVVGPDEQGVVLRFGKEVNIVEPGLHYHLPYPIEVVYTPKVTQSLRLVLGYTGSGDALNPGMMLTADENVVDVRFAVQYRISNPSQYLFATTSPEQLVRYAAESAMREVVGRSKIDGLLTAGRGPVEQKAMSIMQDLLDRYHAGITVDAVQLLEVGPPKAVQPAFLDVTAAREDLERARNEAQAYANNIVPRARGEASAMVTGAEAYKQQVVDRAKGDSARFLDILGAYEKNPKVVSERMYLQTMQDILSHTQKVIIEGKGQPVIYMPMAGHQEHQAGSSTGAAAPTVSMAPLPIAPARSAAAPVVLPGGAS